MKEIDLYSVYLIRTNQKFNFPKKIIKEKSNCFIYELKDENVFLKKNIFKIIFFLFNYLFSFLKVFNFIHCEIIVFLKR